MLGSVLKRNILEVAHDAPVAGYLGFFKTYWKVREIFTWKGPKDDVLIHVKECSTCQQNKVEHTHPTGLLQPLPIPEHKLESVFVDFITQLPKYQGKDNIYVLVDRLKKFAHFFAVTSTISNSEVVSLFFKDIFRLHGFSRNIISDRDSKFTSAFWQPMFKLVGTNLNMSTSYHP